MPTLETALALHAMGLPIVIVPPGEKAPVEKKWQDKRYTADEIRRRFANNPAMNVGVILGSVIDVEGDDEALFEADYAELFEGCEQSETPCWKSKRGLHRLYAADERLTALGTAVVKFKSLEIRLGAGKAAQSLLPPSQTEGTTREWVTPLCPPATLPEKAINRILSAQLPKSQHKKQAITKLKNSRPGDDFCLRGTWREVLGPHGWELAGESDGVQRWRRPGKGEGVSATTGHCRSEAGRELLYVFSSNAEPFRQGKSYSKFAAYAVLNHEDDYREAAAALGKKGYGDKKGPSASTTLIQLAEQADLFHTPAGDGYATVEIGDHRETYSVESRQFKRYLEYQYHLKTKSAAPSKALTEAIGVCAARARFEGKEIGVHIRLAELGNAIYLDLCNDKWEAIQITAAGWQIVQRPPVKFCRTNGMLALPYPVEGDINELRSFVNVTDESWPLLVAGLVAALRPSGPYPICLFISDHGSGKSTSMRVCRRLIDPNIADLRAAPTDVQSLMLAATNAWLVVLDNQSGVRDWLADALCRLSTGGGMGTRLLYSNDEEKLFDTMRPSMLSGIGEQTTREDFLSRCLLIQCPELPEDKRLDEKRFNARFQEARPRIFGALLTAVSGALHDLPTTTLPILPRMADFAMWATAAEPSLGWTSGTFMQAYDRNRMAANDVALDNSLADAIRQLLDPAGEVKHSGLSRTDDAITWAGTAEPLLSILNTEPCSTKEIRQGKDWPRNGASLTMKLNRMAPCLRAAGITAHKHRRTWTLSATLAA